MSLQRKFYSFGTLSDLPGMPKKVPGWSCSSRTDAIRVLRAKRVATTAGDDGSITIWMPRGGGYMVEFDRYMVPVNKATLKNLTEVRRWLKKWWPKMRRGS